MDGKLDLSIYLKNGQSRDDMPLSNKTDAKLSLSSTSVSVSSCYQPTTSEFDNAIAQLCQNETEKLKVTDVFDKIEREHDGNELCPDWRNKLREQLKLRDKQNNSG